MKKTILAAMIAVTGTMALSNAVATPLYHYTNNSPIEYIEGNIFLGFRAIGGTGAANSYVINLGNYGDFPILKGGQLPVALFNIGSSLTSVFGSDWYTRGQVNWGIFGMTDPDIVGVNVYSSTPDERADKPVVRDAGQLMDPYSLYATVGNNFNFARNNGTSTGSTTGVLGIGVVTGTGAGTWGAELARAADFNLYNSTLEAFVSSDLEFYLTDDTKAYGLTQFNINNAGVVSVVPEPSTYALFGIGALLLIVAYRRKITA